MCGDRVRVDAGLGDQGRRAVPGSALRTVGSARNGASLTALANLAPNSPKLANWARSRTRPNVADLPERAWCRRWRGSPRSPSGSAKNSAMPRRSRATWSLHRLLPVRGAQVGAWRPRPAPRPPPGRTLLGPGAEPAVDGLDVVGDPDGRRSATVSRSFRGERLGGTAAPESSHASGGDRVPARSPRHRSRCRLIVEGVSRRAGSRPSPRRPPACAAPGRRSWRTGGPGGPAASAPGCARSSRPPGRR